MNFALQILMLLVIFTLPSFAEKETGTQNKTTQEAAPQEKASQEKASQEKVAKDKAPEEKTDKEKTASEKATKDKTAEKKSKLSPTKPLPEISIGSKTAPVVMIIYSSLSCGHCAHFTTDILPKVEKKYIKPGHLRVVFRDYPGDQISLRAHQLAWCKGEIKYLDFINSLYASQEKWLLASDPVAALKTMALKSGMSAQQFDSCLKNQELLDQIIAARLDGQKKYNITVTPTIIINAKVFQKTLTLEEIDEIMKPFLVASAQKKK